MREALFILVSGAVRGAQLLGRGGHSRLHWLVVHAARLQGRPRRVLDVARPQRLPRGSHFGSIWVRLAAFCGSSSRANNFAALALTDPARTRQADACRLDVKQPTRLGNETRVPGCKSFPPARRTSRGSTSKGRGVNKQRIRASPSAKAAAAARSTRPTRASATPRPRRRPLLPAPPTAPARAAAASASARARCSPPSSP